MKAFDLKTIKARHAAIEIQLEDTNNLCPSNIPHFKTKNAEWSWWKSYLDNELSTSITYFPENVSEEVTDTQVNKPTEIAVNSARKFLGMMIASKKKNKGWQSKNINKARKAGKNAQLIHKKRQTPAKLQYLNEQKIFFQNLIKESKLTFHKNITGYLNQLNDANQFWHRYDKVLGNKKIKIAELLYDSTTGTYVFEDGLITEKH